MPVSVPQRSFTGGEWAPSLHSRVDLSKYATALKLCENFIVQPYGGVTTRPGTRFLAEALDSTKPLRLIPFQFSVEQGYILEFGDYTMRVYKDGALVLADNSGIPAWVISTAYTVGDFVIGTLNDGQCVTWAAGTGYKVGDYVKSSSGGTTIYSRCLKDHIAYAANHPDVAADTDEWEFLGNTPPVNGIYRCILNHTSTAADEPGVGGSWPTYWVLDGVGYGVYEITTPYAAEDLAMLKYEQSFDYLFLQHPGYQPYELSRSAHNNWTLAAVTFGPDIDPPTVLTGGTGTTHSWQVTAVSPDGQESIASNTHQAASGTLTWTAPSGSVHYYNVYMQKNNSGFFGWVARVPSNSHLIDATISPDPEKSPPETQTPFNAVDDYPGVATFFEQRLIYARTNNQPQTLWGSVTGGFRNFNFSTPLRDDDSYEFTLASRQLHDIRWLIPLEDLIIGTGGGEWRMRAGGTGDAITPTSVSLKMQSQWGSSQLRPVVIGNSILFVDASKRGMRDLLYSFQVDGYTGNDLTLLAQHLFKDREIVDLAFAQHPEPVVWAVRDDGILLGLTYAKEHEVWGWHRHVTDGLIENVATIFNFAGEVDTYIVVKRTINGSDVKYIELLEERLPGDEIEEAWCVDSGLQYYGWNPDETDTLELTGGSTWQVGESLTMTASATGTFSSSDVGKFFKLRNAAGSDSDNVIVEVTGYTDGTHVTVTPHNRTVPTSLRATPTGVWARMATTLSGLEHLEGETVQVFTDGNVQPTDVVSSGALSLPQPAAVAVIGLGYECNLETLEIDIESEGQTLQDHLRNVTSLMVRLEKSRALWAGPDEDHLDEVAFREDELYGEPTKLFTGSKEVFVEPGRDSVGRIYLRVQSPVPTSVLALIPKMDFGDG